MSPLESKLRRLAAALDTAALEALANKGLLRRAQKDLERGIETRIAGETATALCLRIGEFEVTLPEAGPATASCSCPAAGVCQHILTAVLYLQGAGGEGEPSSVAADVSPLHLKIEKSEPTHVGCYEELMALTPDQLESWAGKAAFKAGLKLASQFTPEIIQESTIRLQFPAMNSEVHFVPGGGLDGAIISGGKGDGRQLIIAAFVKRRRV